MDRGEQQAVARYEKALSEYEAQSRAVSGDHWLSATLAPVLALPPFVFVRGIWRRLTG